MRFHSSLPLLNLVDQPGFAIGERQHKATFRTLDVLNRLFEGSAAEKMATIRHGASAMSALYNASVPIFTVVIRRAFGVAGGAFADPEDKRGERIAWLVLLSTLSPCQ